MNPTNQENNIWGVPYFTPPSSPLDGYQEELISKIRPLFGISTLKTSLTVDEMPSVVESQQKLSNAHVPVQKECLSRNSPDTVLPVKNNDSSQSPLPFSSSNDHPPFFTTGSSCVNQMISALSTLIPKTPHHQIQPVRRMHIEDNNHMELSGLFDPNETQGLILGEKKMKNGILEIGVFDPKTNRLIRGFTLSNENTSCGIYDSHTEQLTFGCKRYLTPENSTSPTIELGIFDKGTGLLLSGDSQQIDPTAYRRTFIRQTKKIDSETGEIIITQSPLNNFFERYTEQSNSTVKNRDREVGIFDRNTHKLLHGCIVSEGDISCQFGSFLRKTEILIRGYKRFSFKEKETDPQFLIGNFYPPTGHLVTGIKVLFDGSQEQGNFDAHSGQLLEGGTKFPAK